MLSRTHVIIVSYPIPGVATRDISIQKIIENENERRAPKGALQSYHLFVIAVSACRILSMLSGFASIAEKFFCAVCGG